MPPVVSARDARRLFLAAQGLCDDPARPATLSAVAKLIDRLGFVQVDSIQRVARAHHLILGARLDGYRPELLERLAFDRRAVFEHWTHDAAYIPVSLFPHWKLRFERREKEIRRKRWFQERLGSDPDGVLARVHARIVREGALRSRDFERRTGPSKGWWDWTPEKMALEVLWHTGQLAITGRDGFHKVYDLVERVFPEAHALPAPTRDEHVAWACGSALERLGAATPLELSDYWDGVTLGEAKAWCRGAVASGAAAAVELGSAGGKKPVAGVAIPDWPKRLRRAPEPRPGLRLLAPFDPVVRDRDRLVRLFDFAYRFEAYTPAKKRRYGYYVMPVLEGDRLVGRIDPRHDRDRSRLVVDGVWWERGTRDSAARRRGLVRALEKLAAQVGAESVELRK